MPVSVIALIFSQVVLFLAVYILWIRLSRPPKDDPRLSRGLQLLQSKITILEDLSDRTDRQVNQLVSILEERGRVLQSKILKAEEAMVKIQGSVGKSLEVAKIFQDKIPHDEIIERRSTAQFVQAAKMAHAGKSVDEIVKTLGLPRSEVEFIAKVNRDELMFDPESLPDWAQSEEFSFVEGGKDRASLQRVFETPKTDLSGLKRVESDFKSAVQEHKDKETQEEEKQKLRDDRQRQLFDSAKRTKDQIVNTASKILVDAKESTKPIVKKVQFPRVRVDKNL